MVSPHSRRRARCFVWLYLVQVYVFWIFELGVMACALKWHIDQFAHIGTMTAEPREIVAHTAGLCFIVGWMIICGARRSYFEELSIGTPALPKDDSRHREAVQIVEELARQRNILPPEVRVLVADDEAHGLRGQYAASPSGRSLIAVDEEIMGFPPAARRAVLAHELRHVGFELNLFRVVPALMRASYGVFFAYTILVGFAVNWLDGRGFVFASKAFLLGVLVYAVISFAARALSALHSRRLESITDLRAGIDIDRPEAMTEALWRIAEFDAVKRQRRVESVDDDAEPPTSPGFFLRLTIRGYLLLKRLFDSHWPPAKRIAVIQRAFGPYLDDIQGDDAQGDDVQGDDDERNGDEVNAQRIDTNGTVGPIRRCPDSL